jgi:hypothetical protein
MGFTRNNTSFKISFRQEKIKVTYHKSKCEREQIQSGISLHCDMALHKQERSCPSNTSSAGLAESITLSQSSEIFVILLWSRI